MKYRVWRGIGFCLLFLASVGLYGCGGSGGYGAFADANALKSVGWYYENIAPDFFNNGSTCYLTLNLYLTDSVSAADIDSFIIREPNGGEWNIPASGRQAVSSSGTTYFPLRLKFEPSPAFPLAGVWTMTAKLKDGRASSIEKTLHDPGNSAEAIYRYLYSSEDWAPSTNQSQYVPALKRFPAVGYLLQYSSADGGKITTTGFSTVRAAYLVAEPKAYNMYCWLYDENKSYLGYTISAYSGTDHSGSSLIAHDGELTIDPAATTAASSGGSIDLSRVKYVRVVEVDGAQFAPQSYSYFDNLSVSSLISVINGGVVGSTNPQVPEVPQAPVDMDSFQSQLAKYTMSMPKIVKYGDVVPITLTVVNTGNLDININALPIWVHFNNVKIFFSTNVISSGIVSIKPGETRTLMTSWSNKDDVGNIVQPGNYSLVVSCMSERESTDLLIYFTIQ